MVKLFQIWPREPLQSGFCFLLACAHNSLRIFMLSGITGTSRFILNFSLSQPWQQQFVQRALIQFSREGIKKPRSNHQVCSLLLGYLVPHSPSTHTHLQVPLISCISWGRLMRAFAHEPMGLCHPILKNWWRLSAFSWTLLPAPHCFQFWQTCSGWDLWLRHALFLKQDFQKLQNNGRVLCAFLETLASHIAPESR